MPRDLYVSELGAQGEPTARWFQVALLLIVAGGSAIAWAGRRVQSRADAQRLDAGNFAVNRLRAVPVRVAGDLLAAVLAFAGACWAMLQFVATTLAIALLVVFGAVLSARLARPSAVPEPSVA